VNSYEIGLKSNWWDKRVTTSIALVYADYTDVQIPGSLGFDSDGDGTEDSFIGITSNAGDADMLGLELESLAYLSEKFSLGFSLGYLDAKYNEFIDAFGVDVADERVFQNTPEWTSSATLTYETPMSLFSNAGSFAVITSLSYRSETSQFETPVALLDQDAYTLWDLSLVWEDDAGHWQAGLHAKNLTDEEYKVAGYNFPALGLEGSITAFYGNPMTLTATVRYQF
jgi:iron complex outermembrane receptor protein